MTESVAALPRTEPRSVARAATPPPAIAVLPEAEPPAVSDEAPSIPSGNAPDETNVWPDEAAESAFLAEAKERGEVVKPPAPAAEPEESDSKALPTLDELVNRIPSETRELLDELFRARFVAVRKIRKADLKTESSTGTARS